MMIDDGRLSHTDLCALSRAFDAGAFACPRCGGAGAAGRVQHADGQWRMHCHCGTDGQPLSGRPWSDRTPACGWSGEDLAMTERWAQRAAAAAEERP